MQSSVDFTWSIWSEERADWSVSLFFGIVHVRRLQVYLWRNVGKKIYVQIWTGHEARRPSGVGRKAFQNSAGCGWSKLGRCRNWPSYFFQDISPTQLRSRTRNYASNTVFKVLRCEVQFLQEEWLGTPQERQKGSFCRFDGPFSRFCSLFTATCANGEISVEAKVVFLRGESETFKFYSAGGEKRLQWKTERTKCFFRKRHFAGLWHVRNGKSSKFNLREKSNRTVHNGQLVNLPWCRWSIP